jgi:tetratricopeptide (TPR) repeat protein
MDTDRPSLDELRSRAATLAQEGRWDEALQTLKDGEAHYPEDPALLNLLGLAYRGQGRFPEGEACFRKLLDGGNGSATILTNLGCLYASWGKSAEAEGAFRRALARPEQAPEAWYNLGGLFLDQRRLTSAIAALREATRLAPGVPEAWVNLGIALLQLGRGEEALPCFAKASALRPSFLEAHSNWLMTLTYLSGCTAQELRRAHKDFGRWIGAHIPRLPPVPAPALRPGRIRIGYLSSDFRNHATAHFIAPVLPCHDRSRFEVFCYASGLPEDAHTETLRKHADTWVDARGLGDDALAARIRGDGIHVLIDLGGHSAFNRIGVLARKPAPVQVCWIGYPEPTGLDTVDAKISDPVFDPPEEDSLPDRAPVRRLPWSFCFQFPAPTPVGPLPALAQGFPTFGVIQNWAKFNAVSLGLWARVLRALPNSRLVVAGAPQEGGAWAAEALAEEGVLPGRIEWVGKLDGEGFRQLYQRLDLLLDTWPYSGVTTTAFALGYGVPTLSLSGDRPASRQGPSILQSVGLGDWVARTPEAFQRIALEKSTDLESLSALRQALPERVRHSRLADGAGLTLELERVLESLVGEWIARGTPPE